MELVVIAYNVVINGFGDIAYTLWTMQHFQKMKIKMVAIIVAIIIHEYVFI